MKLSKNKKGISLIVLVITIIVMIILASVIIITLANNGIIGKANEAVDETTLKQMQQAAMLAWSDAYVGGARDVDDLKEAVDKAFVDAKIDVSKYEITVTTNGVTVKVKDTTTPPTEPDDGGEGGEVVTPTQLSEPTISLSRDTLTITDNATNGSYTASFEVYVGSEKKATITASSTTTFDLTALELEVGTYNITVKAVAAEGTTIVASGASNYVVYVVVEVSNVPEAWKVNVTAIVDEVPIPKGFVASQAEGESSKEGGLVIYEGTDPVTDETVYDAKRDRNQYVWVPVDKDKFETEFVRKNYLNIRQDIVDESGKYFPLGMSGEYYWEIEVDNTNMPLTKENTSDYKTDNDLDFITEETLLEVQAMYESVKEYGGFYIARYEMGIDKQRTTQGKAADLPGIKAGTKVYSVMGKVPYNWIPWTWDDKMNEDTDGAVEVARSIYPESNSSYGVVSTLTYGVQWDRTLAWWLEEEAQNGTKNVTIKKEANLKDSTSYGNHINNIIAKESFNVGAQYSDDFGKNYNNITSEKSSKEKWLLTTGATEEARVNNIYDMAGNLYEWTIEGLSSTMRVARGGDYQFYGYDFSVAYRGGDLPSDCFFHIGFRPALYIKK